MRKIFAGVLVTAAIGFTIVPALAMSMRTMMHICRQHHSYHRCHTMTHEQMMEMINRMHMGNH